MDIFLQKGKGIAILITAALITAAGVTTHAQTLQWGKRGGSSINGSNVEPHEKVVDMATDKNGNVYLLGYIAKSTSANVDGHPVTAYGGKDAIISSFTCTGAYRWSKVIGGGTDDMAGSIGADTLGHVYVCGKNAALTTAGNEVHFDSDSTQASTNVKALYLVQYDTSGTFRWLRQPNPDTAGQSGNVSSSASLDMVVTGNGDVYWYAMMNPGPVAGGNGWIVTAKNGYILKYNAAGTLTGHIDPQMDISNAGFSSFHFNRTPTGKFIFAGTREFYQSIPTSFTIGGQPMNHYIFIAAFNSAGQYQWKKENANYGSVYSKPAIDAQGNIYIAGTADPGDTLAGHVFVNTLYPTRVSAMVFLGKLDSNGNRLWIKNASAASSSALFNSVALKGSNEVWISGTGGSVWWDMTYKIQAQANEGYYIYASRFNSQGAVLSMDSLKGTFGSQNWALSSTSDRNGNLFIGGEFNGALYTGSQTIASSGGASDFFIAKLGNVCGCITPTASFARSTAGRIVTLTYNGTTTGVDSVVWNYGNNVTIKKSGAAMNTAFTYTYPASGTYNVCVTAYGTCGSNQACQSVTIAGGVGIGSVTADDVQVYPNPANNFLIIDGAKEGTNVVLLNLVGQQMLETEINAASQQISLAGLPGGTYLLVFAGREGNRRTVRILKN